jgi:hypothetical protein
MKQCIACGMPLRHKQDYPFEDETKDYCKYCAREDGSMQNYQEKLAGLTDFIVKTQGIARPVAEKAAVEQLSHLPAWKKN